MCIAAAEVGALWVAVDQTLVVGPEATRVGIEKAVRAAEMRSEACAACHGVGAVHRSSLRPR